MINCNKVAALLLSTGLLLAACSADEPEARTASEARAAADGEVYIWSHNDYEQPRPLEDALEHGAQMIEADIHLIDGELYVAHDLPDPAVTPTLEELYLEPLAELASQQNGVIQPRSNLPFYLVIDVKTEAESTFDVLMDAVSFYENLFSRIENGQRIDGAINLLISGNRPDPANFGPNHIAFIDGRIPDLGEGYQPDIYPVISDNWNNYFTWDGTGDMPEEERELLNTFIHQAHEEDKLIRFWATPDREEVWEVLLEASVDIINVDDLQGVRRFLDQKTAVN